MDRSGKAHGPVRGKSRTYWAFYDAVPRTPSTSANLKGVRRIYQQTASATIVSSCSVVSTRSSASFERWAQLRASGGFS